MLYNFLVTEALSAIAREGKAVVLDADQVATMGLIEDPAMATDAADVLLIDNTTLVKGA